MTHHPFIQRFIGDVKEIPLYLLALKAAVAVLVSALPIYLGLHYFLHRRKLIVPWRFHVAYMSSFILLAGLSFVLASPLAGHIPPILFTPYLFITCFAAAYGIVLILDLFLIQHYLSHVRKIYISPPLRSVLKIGIFCVALLPILHYVLHFNPLTLVAIPTVLTAGIAFAMQDTLKAIIAGVGLGKLIRLGEWISFQGKDGRVIDIDWVRTVLETQDGIRVYIPNNQLQSQMFLNYSKSGLHRMAFQVPVSHHASPEHVKNCMRRSIEGVPGIAASPAPQAEMLSQEENTSRYVLYYWISDYSRRLELQDIVGTLIWNAFRAEQIEVPFPFQSAPLKRADKEIPAKIG